MPPRPLPYDLTVEFDDAELRQYMIENAANLREPIELPTEIPILPRTLSPGYGYLFLDPEGIPPTDRADLSPSKEQDATVEAIFREIGVDLP